MSNVSGSAHLKFAPSQSHIEARAIGEVGDFDLDCCCATEANFRFFRGVAQPPTSKPIDSTAMLCNELIFKPLCQCSVP